jgi:hypothetical protein
MGSDMGSDMGAGHPRGAPRRESLMNRGYRSLQRPADLLDMAVIGAATVAGHGHPLQEAP